MNSYLNMMYLQQSIKNKTKIVWLLCVFICLGPIEEGLAQSSVFGPKIGPSISFQRWRGAERDALPAFHGAFFIESYTEGSASSLYAQIGYHKRGSREDVLFNSGSGGFRQSQTYQFNNIALQLGAKKILRQDRNAKPYYIVGIRAEYTLNTNLGQYEASQFALYFPLNEFVNKFNYGFTFGGGFQYDFSELIGGAIEISIHPDVSKQYNQPLLSNIINPRGNPVDLPAQQIRNLTLEISAVFRFKRIVEYID